MKNTMKGENNGCVFIAFKTKEVEQKFQGDT